MSLELYFNIFSIFNQRKGNNFVELSLQKNKKAVDIILNNINAKVQPSYNIIKLKEALSAF